MATTSTLFSTPSLSPALQSHSKLTPSSHSFLGLRRTNLSTTTTIATTFAPTRPTRNKSCIVRAELSPSLVISLSTGLSLFLGRFVFFNFQRENVAKQGLPSQNGKSHFEAGDSRAQEYVALLKSTPGPKSTLHCSSRMIRSGSISSMCSPGDPLVTLWLTISWPLLAMAMTPTSLVERFKKSGGRLSGGVSCIGGG